MDLKNLNSARNILSDNVINIALSFSELNYKTFSLQRRNIICLLRHQQHQTCLLSRIAKLMTAIHLQTKCNRIYFILNFYYFVHEMDCNHFEQRASLFNLITIISNSILLILLTFKQLQTNPNKIIMPTIKTFQRTVTKKNGDLPQNPENTILPNASNLSTDQKSTEGVQQLTQCPQKALLRYICQIYQNIKVYDDSQLQAMDQGDECEDRIVEMVKTIIQEIERLQQREEQYLQLFRKLQNSNKKPGNEQKWKLIVLTYKQKITNLQSNLRAEREGKLKLQETIELQIEQKQRLSQLNNIKYRKIGNLMADLEQKQTKFEELGQTISQLEGNLSQFRQKNSVLQVKLDQLENQNMDLSNQLDYERQRSFLLAQEREQIVIKFKVLGDEEQQINKQIRDLKCKYQIEIAKLQNKVANLSIQNQELLLLIDQLQMSEFKSNLEKFCIDKETQTQNEVVKACYFNSLADELSDYNEHSFEMQSENLGLINQSNYCQHNGENLTEEFNLHLELGCNSQHNNQIYTERLAERQYYAKETLSQRGLFAARVQTSFDDGVSVSNTPSKYLQTMGELTNELSEAYQKINELTTKVGQLEGQKARVERKLRENQGQKQTKSNQRQKRGFGYFSSFFKK